MNITKEYILLKLKEQEEILIPKQNKMSLPILYRICKKMEHNLKFKSIWVCSDNIIIEGHHRYIASIIIGYNIGVVANYPRPSELNVFTWDSVEFVEEDWDTTYKIRMLNEEDARYNDLTLEQIQDIVS